ncbi:hypothetical protein VNO77_19802 [Canavalia gladiata]|uniref:Uncharacterized protein n=1 Tax=Canavalia gladiata TaxID=3824 RepID=A0AAN9LNG6_CANGL
MSRPYSVYALSHVHVQAALVVDAGQDMAACMDMAAIAQLNNCYQLLVKSAWFRRLNLRRNQVWAFLDQGSLIKDPEIQVTIALIEGPQRKHTTLLVDCLNHDEPQYHCT